MNLSQLRAFVAVVDRGSFSGAARTLGLSQPSVTMQIQALESGVGVALFDRQPRRIVLTEAGQVLLPHARRVLAELERAHGALDALSDAVSGRVHIAASTTPGQYVLPRLLGPFLAAHPGVTLALSVHDSAGVVSCVEEGEADLGMTGADLHSRRLAAERAGTDTLVLIGPPGHPLVVRGIESLRDIAAEPFVVREAGSGTRVTAEEVLRQGGVDPAELAVVMELGTNEAVVSAVEGGMGLGIVSSHVAEKAIALGTVAEVRGPGLPIERPLFLVTPRRSLTRAASALADYVREWASGTGAA